MTTGAFLFGVGVGIWIGRVATEYAHARRELRRLALEREKAARKDGGE